MSMLQAMIDRQAERERRTRKWQERLGLKQYRRTTAKGRVIRFTRMSVDRDGPSGACYAVVLLDWDGMPMGYPERREANNVGWSPNPAEIYWMTAADVVHLMDEFRKDGLSDKYAVWDRYAVEAYRRFVEQLDADLPMVLPA